MTPHLPVHLRRHARATTHPLFQYCCYHREGLFDIIVVSEMGYNRASSSRSCAGTYQKQTSLCNGNVAVRSIIKVYETARIVALYQNDYNASTATTTRRRKATTSSSSSSMDHTLAYDGDDVGDDVDANNTATSSCVQSTRDNKRTRNGNGNGNTNSNFRGYNNKKDNEYLIRMKGVYLGYNKSKAASASMEARSTLTSESPISASSPSSFYQNQGGGAACVSDDDDDDDDTVVLYVNDFILQPPRYGGHVLLGSNSCGKSLFSDALVDFANNNNTKDDDYKNHNNNIETDKRTTTNSNDSSTETTTNIRTENNMNVTSNNPLVNVSRVSFESHEHLLAMANRSKLNNKNMKRKREKFMPSSASPTTAAAAAPAAPGPGPATTKTATTAPNNDRNEKNSIYNLDVIDINNEDEDNDNDKIDIGLTVYSALTPDGGQLNKATQFLVVRFGLYSMLSRDVRTLSTGEIRKVLLIRALSTKPQLLILDNAFDGLDVPSRTVLKELVSKTLHGFKNDILVQGVNANSTSHTQVLLITHRPEEIVDGISTVSYIVNPEHQKQKQHQQQQQQQQQQKNEDKFGSEIDRSNPVHQIRTEPRNGRNGIELLQTALYGATTNSDSKAIDLQQLYHSCWTDPSLPSKDQIYNIWNLCEQISSPPPPPSSSSSSSTKKDNTINHPHPQVCDSSVTTTITTTSTIIDMKNFTLQRGNKELLQNISWDVSQGQSWLLAGGNGMGKSTLSRALVYCHPSSSSVLAHSNRSSTSHDNAALTNRIFRLNLHPSEIGWVSTELHLSLLQQEQHQHRTNFPLQTAWDIIRYGPYSIPYDNSNNKNDTLAKNLSNRTIITATEPDHMNRIIPAERIHEIASSWMNLNKKTLLDRPFLQLSQGEQKLVLIAASIAKLPRLLILDEPLQGLDLMNRRLVLGLLEHICQATDMSLLYITHHMEELIPSVTHVLHLKDGRSVFDGRLDDGTYNPKDYL